MAVRQVRFELEAQLEGASGATSSRSSGKLERKSYRDGGDRLKVAVRNVPVPNYSTAQVVSDGKQIAEVLIIDGKGQVDFEGTSATHIPQLRTGQRIEIFVGEAVVLSGTLRID